MGSEDTSLQKLHPSALEPDHGCFQGKATRGGYLRQSRTVSAEEVDALLKSDPVTTEDILSALATARPSGDGNMNKYNEWQAEYGAV